MTLYPPPASDEIVIVNDPAHRLNMQQLFGSEMMKKVLAAILLAFGLAVPAFAGRITSAISRASLRKYTAIVGKPGGRLMPDDRPVRWEL